MLRAHHYQRVAARFKERTGPFKFRRLMEKHLRLMDLREGPARTPPTSLAGSDVGSVLSGLIPIEHNDEQREVWTMAEEVQGVEVQTIPPLLAATTQTLADGVACQANINTYAEEGMVTDPWRQDTGTSTGVHGEPLPMEQWARVYTPKYRVYFKGKKQQQRINRLPHEEAEKLPTFVFEPKVAQLAKPVKTSLPCHRAKLLKALTSDVDLVYALKMEAAFIPRSISLLQQLKQKARKWLAGWDMSLYTSQQIYEMTMNAIGQAMLVDTHEERVRAALHIAEERELNRPRQNQFLVEGRTGLGSSTCLNRPLGKVSAWRRLVGRRLTRAIAF